MNQPTAPNRHRDLIELCVGYGLILLVIWAPNPWQRRLYLVAVLVILAFSWRTFEGWEEMGLRRTNLLRSLWIVGTALLLATGSFVIAASFHTLRTFHSPFEVVQRFWGYAIWAFAQQFLLQIFFLQRFLRLLPNRKLAVSAAAAIFAVAHLPNPILTIVTLLWGVAACVLFLRYRNFLPLALAHIILGVCVAVSVPGSTTHNMRVGLSYLTYHPHRGHRFHQMP